jgi:capsid portal protein
MKKLFFTLLFQIGVSVIGIPETHKHVVNLYKNEKSKYHS